MSKEINDAIQRSGFKCPYNENALCTQKCPNQLNQFATWVAVAGISEELEESGEPLTGEQEEKLVEDRIQESMINGDIKEIDCRPTFPESQ